MHSRVLADVEGVEMESELANFSQQGRDVGVGETLSAIRLQAHLDEHQVLLEISGTAIRRRRIDRFPSVPQFVKDVREKTPVTLGLVVWSPGKVYARNRALVVMQTSKKIF